MPGPVFLEGEHVTLHPVEDEDLDFLQACVNHPRVRRGIMSVEPQNGRDEEEWLESVDTDENVPLLVCADDHGDGDTVADGDSDDGVDDRENAAEDEHRVGLVGLNRLNGTFGNAEIGYYFHPDAWGNGYATEAVRQVVGYAFRERRLHKVYARCYAHNDASRRVLEKAGFQQEGVLREQAFVDGEYVDVYRYGVLVDEWRDGVGGTGDDE